MPHERSLLGNRLDQSLKLKGFGGKNQRERTYEQKGAKIKGAKIKGSKNCIICIICGMIISH